MSNLEAGLGKLGVKTGSVVCMWCSNYVEYWLLCLAVWNLGATILPINCLTNTERLQEQLRETSTSVLVCDSFNVDQGMNMVGLVESVEQVLLINQESHEDVVTVHSLMETEAESRKISTFNKFDWDKTPILMMYTTRCGESKIVKHTNKSMTAQVFSPKGTSNHWFDQVTMMTTKYYFTHYLIRMLVTRCSALLGSSTTRASCAWRCVQCRA